MDKLNKIPVGPAQQILDTFAAQKNEVWTPNDWVFAQVQRLQPEPDVAHDGRHWQGPGTYDDWWGSTWEHR